MQVEPFDVTDLEDIGYRWTMWLKKLTRYFRYRETEYSEKKINELFLFGGNGLEEIYDQYMEDDDEYDDVIEKITDHFSPTTNIQLNRFNFHNLAQYPDETFDEFVKRVKLQAKLCNFEDHDTQCASQII